MLTNPRSTYSALPAFCSLKAARLAQGLAWVFVGLAAVAGPGAIAQTPPQAPAPTPREVPAKALPVSATVSPQLQRFIAQPLTPTWNVIPKTPAQWKAQVNARAAAAMLGLPSTRRKPRRHLTKSRAFFDKHLGK